MNPQQIIDSFFIQDGQIQPQGSAQRSVLLALEGDLGFCILLPKIWKGDISAIKLSDSQYTTLQEKLPSFTVISLFCTAIDVLARVVNKSVPPNRQNGIYFTSCAQTWFGLTNAEANQLWLLRNGISHSYKIVAGQSTRQVGYGGIIKQRTIDNVWEFYLHAMYTSLIKAKREIYENLSNETLPNKQATANYLQRNGFFFTR